MPFDGTRVIPEGWAAHHRPVAEATMTATVRLTHAAGDATPGQVDPTTGRRTGSEATHYFEGAARIQAQPSVGRDAVTGDQMVTTVGYLITLTLDGTSDAAVDDLVEVTAVDANGDPSLVGRVLQVEGVLRGSLAFERDLYCTDNLG